MAAIGATQAGSAENELLYKVLVVGDVGVGKTSIIKRTVHNIFNANYKATIGVDFALKVVQRKNPADKQEPVVKMQLWDIAGQERFGGMTHVYFKQAVAAFVVFDLTRPATLEACVTWKKDIDSKVFLGKEENQIPIPTILLGNKSDSDPKDLTITDEEIGRVVKDNNFVKFLKTSAKNNINLEEAIYAIREEIFKSPAPSLPPAIDPSRVKIDGSGEQQTKDRCPC